MIIEDEYVNYDQEEINTESDNNDSGNGEVR